MNQQHNNKQHRNEKQQHNNNQQRNEKQPRKINFEHVFGELEEYMFSSNNIIRNTTKIFIPSSNKSGIKNKNTKSEKKTHDYKSQESMFIPAHRDKLFWSFYIIMHGIDKYEFIKNDNFSVEKSFKIATVEKLRGMNDILKQANVSRNEIENELVNERAITVKGLHALCLVYGISIMYVFNMKYCEFCCGSAEHGIIVQANKGYGIKYDEDEVYMKYVRKNYWLIDNIQKPIRAFSTYPMKEIQDICSRLGISLVDTEGTKIHKKGLYENILSKL